MVETCKLCCCVLSICYRCEIVIERERTEGVLQNVFNCKVGNQRAHFNTREGTFGRGEKRYYAMVV